MQKQTLPCPVCEGTMHFHPSFNLNEGDCRYPRFDRGLGTMLRNEAHRQEICKARGLVPIEGDYDGASVLSQHPYRKMEQYEALIADLDKSRAPAHRYQEALDSHRKELAHGQA